ncbi:uncharacterized protein LOC131628660 [Vicia villosa]|uniref:uncharacterized protein LOC131628660 n=1 Tax=Vicia villosa TaxID=3911 RepID=UPI00273AB683|nr:uncharacterized protein LOC131628660 [Vicia villosa]
MCVASSTSNINGEHPLNANNKGYQTDTLGLYFMHPNENLALVLVSPLLLTNNYHSLSKSMTMVIRSKNKLHFINDSVPPRALDEDHNSIRAYKDGDQVIRILKGLNDQYSAVRSQIMLMEPLPTICKVYSLLVQQDRQVILPLDESKVLVFPNLKQPQKNTSKPSGNSRGIGIKGGRSFGGRGRGSRADVPDKTDASQNDFNEDNEQVQGNLEFTIHQHKALLAILRAPNINHLTTQIENGSSIISTIPNYPRPQNLILDTGAIDHLISIPKLTKQLKCQLVFNDNDYMIHDTHSNKIIDTTRLNGGLYILDSPSVTLYRTPFAHSINTLHDHYLDTTHNCNLWHLRLDHPSIP